MAIFRNKDKDIPLPSTESQPASPQADLVVEQPIQEVPPVPSVPVEQPISIIPDPVSVEQQPQVEQPQPVMPEVVPVQQEIQQPQQKEAEGALRRRRKATQTDDQQQAAQQQAPVAQPKTDERKEIESLLSEGLQDVYLAMTPQQQEQFRVKGEQTATAIEEMVTQFKASARKVVQLIRSWLNTIPGVNKYFLEQESKIKTDEIMKYQKKLKKKRKSRVEIQ